MCANVASMPLKELEVNVFFQNFVKKCAVIFCVLFFMPSKMFFRALAFTILVYPGMVGASLGRPSDRWFALLQCYILAWRRGMLNNIRPFSGAERSRKRRGLWIYRFEGGLEGSKWKGMSGLKWWKWATPIGARINDAWFSPYPPLFPWTIFFRTPNNG